MGSNDRATGPLTAALGAKIRGLRAESKMSVRDLALKSDVAYGTLRKIEDGYRADVENVAKIAAVFRLSVAELISNAERDIKRRKQQDKPRVESQP